MKHLLILNVTCDKKDIYTSIYLFMNIVERKIIEFIVSVRTMEPSKYDISCTICRSRILFQV